MFFKNLFSRFRRKKHLQPNVAQRNEAVHIRVVRQFENLFEFLLRWTPFLLGHVHVADQSPWVRMRRIDTHGFLEEQRSMMQIAFVSDQTTQPENA